MHIIWYWFPTAAPTVSVAVRPFPFQKLSWSISELHHHFPLFYFLAAIFLCEWHIIVKRFFSCLHKFSFSFLFHHFCVWPTSVFRLYKAKEVFSSAKPSGLVSCVSTMICVLLRRPPWWLSKWSCYSGGLTIQLEWRKG